MAIYEVIQEFTSSRDPLTRYAVHRRIDQGPKRGALSCTCPGWTRRVAADGSRSCKHTKQVEQQLGLQTANRQAAIAVNRAARATGTTSTVEQTLAKATATKAPVRHAPQPAAMEASPFDGVLRRRITLDD